MPLFLRNGHLILQQNATGVHQTKDLNNSFQLVAGMKKDSSDPNRYYAYGQIMSIRDYNDDSKIKACISGGCQYSFNANIRLNSPTKTLTVSVSVIGGSSTM